MTTNDKSLHRSVACLKLPTKVPALITYAQGIVKGMTGNASFPTPTPTLTDVTNAINDLQTAEATALARIEGAADKWAPRRLEVRPVRDGSDGSEELRSRRAATDEGMAEMLA